MANPLEARLAQLRIEAERRAQPLKQPHPGLVLFLSASDGKSRARVAHGTGASFDEAWAVAASALGDRAGVAGARWLKVDWVTSTVQTNWAGVQRIMERTKRNYFRRGLALSPDFSVAFLEQELNANAMLYGGNSLPHAVLNEGNFRLYARSRFGEDIAIKFDPEAKLHLFATQGVFLDESGVVHDINVSGPDGGRRRLERLMPPDVYGLIERSSRYLTRQVGDDGRFVYGYHPCFDRQINTYNTLRHASTTYSMIEAWEVTRDGELLSAIERALACLSESLIRTDRLSDGSDAAFLLDSNDEIKLGGNAVAVLAFAKYAAATGSGRYLNLAELLANGIAFMQDSRTGAFVHVLNAGDLSLKAAYRTIYYDGEAAFGLMRLYEQTGNPRWLEMVERAFDHFIAAEHWRHHDHWLSYCVNELTRYRPEERYFRFGIANFADHLDFVRSRITTFPTLLELMMAAERMLERIGGTPDLAHLLDDVDLVQFHEALDRRTHHLLNGHFWPELAMYFRNPARIVDSFFIRHHAFRVRIDDVEHYLSGFVAYHAFLLRRLGQGGDDGFG